MRSATENRIAVAYQLADVLTEHLGTVDLDVLRGFGDVEWHRIAELAGRADYTPSLATRSTVIGVLRERQSTADPFEGF